MAEFEVRIDRLRRNAENGQNIYRKMDAFSDRIYSIADGLVLESGTGRIVKKKLGELAGKTSDNAEKTQKLFYSLESIITCYESGERKIIGEKGNTDAKKEEKENIWTRLWEKHETIAANVAGGSVATSGSILGFDASGTAAGNVLGGSLTTKSKRKWDPKKKEVEVSGSIDAEGHLAEGSASGNIGFASGSIKGKVGTVAATGTIGASLYKDGKFSPAITGKMKAEAAVAQGEAKVKAGRENYNAHANANGTVLGAEAEASGSAGKITYKDEATGKTKTEWGVKGKVGAEAYVVQGKVSGGITIFGVKIDVGIGGKAGGAGISAEGRFTNGSAKGKIGAGLGVGGELEIGIDWSNFSFKW